MAHRLSEIDEQALQAACSQCGPVQIRRKRDGRRPSGYTFQCREKRRAEQRRQRPPGTRTGSSWPKPPRKVEPECERCGFVPEDPCQLEIDHIIPRWKGGTNARENLQTLCCNCHALKSKQDVIEWRAAKQAAKNPADS